MTNSMPDAEVTEAEVVAYFADHVMDAVRGDVSRGYVPRDVASWTELHNHVDANQYSEAADLDSLSGALVNAVDAECDRRIRAGELRTALTYDQQQHLNRCSDPVCESCLSYMAATDAHRAAIAGECSHGGHGWDGETCSDIPVQP